MFLFLQPRVDHCFRPVPEGVKHRGCAPLCRISPSAPCVVLPQHHCPSRTTDPPRIKSSFRPGATPFPFSPSAMPMARHYSSGLEIFIHGPQSPEMSPNQSVVDLCPHHFCEDIPKASDVPLPQPGQAVLFQGTQRTNSYRNNYTHKHRGDHHYWVSDRSCPTPKA